MERKLNLVYRQGRVLGEGWRVSVSDLILCLIEIKEQQVSPGVCVREDN